MSITARLSNILDFNTGMGDGLVGNEKSDLGGT